MRARFRHPWAPAVVNLEGSATTDAKGRTMKTKAGLGLVAGATFGTWALQVAPTGADEPADAGMTIGDRVLLPPETPAVTGPEPQPRGATSNG
ncbi:hypothetical protein [Actinoplanes sp. NPDC051851]|uniref:hypothetical protein n=1 Tax=Actinoplanes sp. NPDC051851 TaxID=3154753 RepID=UPI0034206C4A